MEDEGVLQVIPENQDTLPVEAIRRQINLIQEMMKAVMEKGQHFDTIPGTNKPTLLKAGAEKLCLTFKLAPRITSEDIVDFEGGHREYRLRMELVHRVTQAFMGEGVGSCSTMETKYRYRNAGRKCPECGIEDKIIKGKEEYGGGWLCFAKKGGCGARFEDGDASIEGQQASKIEHPDPADYWNTCYKMAYKRALVSATIAATAASDIFTQDIEDMPSVNKQSSTTAPEKAPLEDSVQPTGDGPKPSNPDALISEGQVKYVHVLLGKLNLKDDFAKHKGITEYLQKVGMLSESVECIDSIKDLNMGQASALIGGLNAAIKEQEG